MQYRCAFLRRIRSVVAALVIVTAMACKPAETSKDFNVRGTAPRGDDMRYLGSDNPLISSPVSAADVARSPKFVVVRITQVQNPRRVPLSFTVSFRPARGEKFTLGTFSLYPADRPGRFIVATQGKVEPSGEILVELTTSVTENVSQVRVGVAEITLGSE